MKRLLGRITNNNSIQIVVEWRIEVLKKVCDFRKRVNFQPQKVSI